MAGRAGPACSRLDEWTHLRGDGRRNWVKRNGNGYMGMRTTVLGMARQGLAVCALPAGQPAPASPSATSARPSSWPSAIAPGSCSSPREHGVPEPQFALGGHPLSLLDETDLLLLSGGVSPGHPNCRRGATPGHSADQRRRADPAPLSGAGDRHHGLGRQDHDHHATGLILERAGYRVHVGGNIGTPLIDRLDEIQRGDKVVMELSSFQLELMDRSPAIAAVLNITPNHLDRHPSMSHYAAAKANILRFQERSDVAVLNADDGYTGAWLASRTGPDRRGRGPGRGLFPASGRDGRLQPRAQTAGRRLPVGRRTGLAPTGRPDAVICSIRRRAPARPPQPGKHPGRGLPELGGRRAVEAIAAVATTLRRSRAPAGDRARSATA